MNLKFFSLFGLVILFLLAQIATFKYSITRNRFYAPFHFVGGFLSAIFLFSFTGNYLAAVFGTIGIGVLWEIYEYLLWRFVLKEKRFKQERQDTLNDLVLDFVGGISAVAIFIFFS